MKEAPPQPESTRRSIAVWVAEGFGLGRIPKAPGTFGTLLGFPLLALFLLPGQLTTFLGLIVFSVLISIWLCAQAEHELNRRDPGSVVIDEIIAIPICYLGWILWLKAQGGPLPGPGFFLAERWPSALGIFALFRLFDIWKPWPAHQSQSLPGGWGVTADDVLAAGYVNLVVLAVLWAT